MHVTVKYLGYFEITVKFAFNIQKILQLKDDACLDGRVACIKLVDEDKGGPLDLIFTQADLLPITALSRSTSLQHLSEAVTARSKAGAKRNLASKRSPEFSEIVPPLV